MFPTSVVLRSQVAKLEMSDKVNHIRRAVVVLACALFSGGCSSTSSPSASPQNALTITATSPAAGTTIVVPAQYPYNVPGGVVVPKGSGLLSVTVTMSAGNNVPWAELYVYLLTGGTTDQYCGQNLPDAPTWQFLTPGWNTTFTVSGFQIYRLPCDVTGFRAMLHMRNNGLLIPPTPSETVAESTAATTLHLLR
jgi:hypothetical protein